VIMKQVRSGLQDRLERCAAGRLADWHGFLDDWHVYGPPAALPDRLRAFSRRTNHTDADLSVLGQCCQP